MKKFLAFVCFITQAAFASEVVVLEKALNELPRFDDTNTIFQVNRTDAVGFIRLSATRTSYHHRCSGTGTERDCDIEESTVFVHSEDIAVADLHLDGDKLIYRGSAGSIECATLGVSRVLRRPTLFLTGACQSTSAVVKKNGQKFLQVKFVTKE